MAADGRTSAERPFIGTGIDDDVIYAQLGEQWTTIANSLPAIDGWKLQAEIVGYAAIGQYRLAYLEIDEPDGLRAFDAHIAAPGTEVFRYRQKLARARQQLVRTRSEELVRRRITTRPDDATSTDAKEPPKGGAGVTPAEEGRK